MYASCSLTLEALVAAHPERIPPATQDMSEAQCQLPRGPRSARRAREFLRTQLAEWKVDDDTASTAELLLSELVSNSIRHARTPAGREIGVRVARYDGHLRVEVADADSTLPKMTAATTEDEQGRGLILVSSLAARWGVCPRLHGIGKATWAELALRPVLSPGT
ncbi:ATP-binding protein [Streptomyces sp. NPDC018693]|uniref:ATP-binding protein n=1 Tax=unclassified Streptomyces TaxID=2593676 RepID=UPI0037AF6986